MMVYAMEEAINDMKAANAPSGQSNHQDNSKSGEVVKSDNNVSIFYLLKLFFLIFLVVPGYS